MFTTYTSDRYDTPLRETRLVWRNASDVTPPPSPEQAKAHGEVFTQNIPPKVQINADEVARVGPELAPFLLERIKGVSNPYDHRIVAALAGDSRFKHLTDYDLLLVGVNPSNPDGERFDEEQRAHLRYDFLTQLAAHEPLAAVKTELARRPDALSRVFGSPRDYLPTLQKAIEGSHKGNDLIANPRLWETKPDEVYGLFFTNPNSILGNIFKNADGNEPPTKEMKAARLEMFKKEYLDWMIERKKTTIDQKKDRDNWALQLVNGHFGEAKEAFENLPDEEKWVQGGIAVATLIAGYMAFKEWQPFRVITAILGGGWAINAAAGALSPDKMSLLERTGVTDAGDLTSSEREVIAQTKKHERLFGATSVDQQQALKGMRGIKVPDLIRAYYASGSIGGSVDMKNWQQLHLGNMKGADKGSVRNTTAEASWGMTDKYLTLVGNLFYTDASNLEYKNGGKSYLVALAEKGDLKLANGRVLQRSDLDANGQTSSPEMKKLIGLALYQKRYENHTLADANFALFATENPAKISVIGAAGDLVKRAVTVVTANDVMGSYTDRTAAWMKNQADKTLAEPYEKLLKHADRYWNDPTGQLMRDVVYLKDGSWQLMQNGVAIATVYFDKAVVRIEPLVKDGGEAWTEFFKDETGTLVRIRKSIDKKYDEHIHKVFFEKGGGVYEVAVVVKDKASAAAKELAQMGVKVYYYGKDNVLTPVGETVVGAARAVGQHVYVDNVERDLEKPLISGSEQLVRAYPEIGRTNADTIAAAVEKMRTSQTMRQFLVTIQATAYTDEPSLLALMDDKEGLMTTSLTGVFTQPVGWAYKGSGGVLNEGEWRALVRYKYAEMIGAYQTQLVEAAKYAVGKDMMLDEVKVGEAREKWETQTIADVETLINTVKNSYDRADGIIRPAGKIRPTMAPMESGALNQPGNIANLMKYAFETGFYVVDGIAASTDPAAKQAEMKKFAQTSRNALLQLGISNTAARDTLSSAYDALRTTPANFFRQESENAFHRRAFALRKFAAAVGDIAHYDEAQMASNPQYEAYIRGLGKEFKDQIAHLVDNALPLDGSLELNKVDQLFSGSRAVSTFDEYAEYADIIAGTQSVSTGRKDKDNKDVMQTWDMLATVRAVPAFAYAESKGLVSHISMPKGSSREMTFVVEGQTYRLILDAITHFRLDRLPDGDTNRAENKWSGVSLRQLSDVLAGKNTMLSAFSLFGGIPRGGETLPAAPNWMATNAPPAKVWQSRPDSDKDTEVDPTLREAESEALDLFGRAIERSDVRGGVSSVTYAKGSAGWKIDITFKNKTTKSLTIYPTRNPKLITFIETSTKDQKEKEEQLVKWMRQAHGL